MIASNATLLSAEMERDVLPWLKIAEDLRNLSLESELHVPQICVMGDQSSGKSSVLNLLAGDVIFPSGTGLVTRCPIRLIMRKAHSGDNWSAHVSTSISPKRMEASDVENLCQLIALATNSLCQGASNFSKDSVIVELCSSNACDLTVVDLPGIVRTATSGQKPSVIADVNSLISSFLQDRRTIILAVIPANQDIATVDILERAQNVDPLGERTLGVLTKVDLINPGGEDEVLSVVTNVRKPLALGYIMVKNRSQLDLNNNMTTAQARDSERRFFQSHEIFQSCDSRVWGVDQLSKRLSALLVTRIQLQLLPMKTHVEQSLGSVRADLRAISPMGSGVACGSQSREQLLVTTMQQYIRLLTDGVRGDYSDRIMARHPSLRLYTLALKAFESFKIKINATAPPFKQPSFVYTLAEQIEQLRGRELPGFMSSQAFFMSMAQYVDAWESPVRNLAEEVRDIVQEVAGRLADVLIAQYPCLRETIRTAASDLLSASLEVTALKMTEVLSREKDPFTMNDFLQLQVNKLKVDRFNLAVDACFENAKTPASDWAGLKEEIYASMRQWYRQTHSVTAMASAQEMCAILEAYWQLSAKRLTDNMCMLVDREILGTISAALQEHMFHFVKDDAKLESFFVEDPLLEQRRAALESRRDRLVLASSALSRIQIRAQTRPFGGPSGTQGGAGNSNSRGDMGPLNSNSSSVPKSRLLVTVAIGASGIGLIVTDEETANGIVIIVKDLRKMPGGIVNPSEHAGILVGDEVEKINGETPATLKDAVNMLKNSQQSVTLTVLRKQ